MSARVIALLLALGVLAAACTQVVPDAAGPAVEAERAQILVTVRQPAARAALGLVGDPDTRYFRRRNYGAAPGVDRTLDRIAREHGIRRVRGWLINSLDVYCEVYELAPGQELDQLLTVLADDPRIDIAQPMNIFETQASRYNDPYADMQTAVALLAVEPAHALATGLGVTVAVIDSQVDRRHPELRARIGTSRDLVADGILRAEAEIHGTAVAGIIASTADNTEGIVGVAPDVEIAALRACRAADPGKGAAQCSSFSLALALELAIRLDADVINLSLAGPRDPLLGQLIDAAIADGRIVIAAMPDSGKQHSTFPASHPGVIAVKSAGTQEQLGGTNLLVAPGEEVLTTVPRSGYAFLSGNSMAAALVSGVAALLIERRPGISAPAIVELLTATRTATSINACLAVARLAPDGACEPPDAGATREVRLRRPR